MKKHENIIISKIVCEFTDYLLNHNFNEVTTKIITSDLETIITIETMSINDDLLVLINEHLLQKRDAYLELEGSSLVGEGDYFHIVGSLIDEHEILNQTNKTIFILKRKVVNLF